MPARSRLSALAATALVVVALDQLSKVVVVATLNASDPKRRIDIVGNWLALEYAENRGVAFGILATAGPWLAFVPFVVLAGLVGYYFAANAPSRWETVAVGVIVGGAAGNLIDRLRLGYVVDYVSVGVWPNFNVADSAITLGVMLFLCGWLVPGGRSDSRTPCREADVHGSGSRPEQRVRS